MRTKEEFKINSYVITFFLILQDYQVHSNPRGLVLIINIMNFSYRPSEVRSGSEIDVERIKEVWERLGFKVKVKNDLKLTVSIPTTV